MLYLTFDHTPRRGWLVRRGKSTICKITQRKSDLFAASARPLSLEELGAIESFMGFVADESRQSSRNESDAPSRRITKIGGAHAERTKPPR